jgi:arsenate reductase-like glutaredoxin family protein
MLNEINNWLKKLGINDFEDLRSDEKETYFKLLELAETKITLEDVKKHISEMRLSVEFAITEEEPFIYSKMLPFLKRENPKYQRLQARLKNYILLESLFNRPERAKQVLEQYTKRK